MSRVHVAKEVASMKLVEAEVSRLAEVPVALTRDCPPKRFLGQVIANIRQLVLVKVKFNRLAGGETRQLL